MTVEARPDRSGTLLRTSGGTDSDVRPDTYFAGDRLTGQHAVCVLGFPLGEGTQLPSNTEIDSVTLHVYVGVSGGDPSEMAPLVLSHLPGHPDAILTPGLVPHPPGDDIGNLDDVTNPGWRTFDVTAAFLQDFNAGRTISAFALRLANPNDGDLEDDVLSLHDGSETGRARIVVRLSLDL